MSRNKNDKGKMSDKQLKAIRRNYAIKAKQDNPADKSVREDFPKEFPFWARMKIGKNRTALVIDEEPVINKNTNKIEDGFVHREVTHTENKRYEKIEPNPDKTDTRPMYLKRPSTKPKRLFKPHNKDLEMPQELKERYNKNNHKDK